MKYYRHTAVVNQSLSHNVLITLETSLNYKLYLLRVLMESCNEPNKYYRADGANEKSQNSSCCLMMLL